MLGPNCFVVTIYIAESWVGWNSFTNSLPVEAKAYKKNIHPIKVQTWDLVFGRSAFTPISLFL
jgi:hypothetical protein